MWLQFFAAYLAGALLLLAPGYALARACRADFVVALGAAPAVSVACYQLWAIVLAKLGIWASWATIALPVIAVAFVTWCASARLLRARRTVGAHAATHAPSSGYSDASSWEGSWLPAERVQRIAVLAFLAVSFAVAMYAFVMCLDGPSSYQQSYDNLSHMARIKLFVEEGWFAPFGLDLYPDLGPASPSASHSSSFYPSGWVCVAALVKSLAGASVAMAENVANFLFMALVYPLGACLLACVLMPRARFGLAVAAVLVLGFASYPWGMLDFGPVYPNMAGNAFVPAVVACFMLLCKAQSPGQAVSLSAVFLVSALGMALTHPNAVFAAAVMLAPYAAYAAYRLLGSAGSSERGRVFGIVAGCAVVLAACLVWLALYRSSMFAGVVGYGAWTAYDTVAQAVADVAVLSLRNANPQPAIALLAYVGVAWSLRHRERRWLVASAAIAAVMFVVNASTDGFAKSLLTGFWYSDAYRVSAVLAMAELPLAFLGANALTEALAGLVFRRRDGAHASRQAVAAVALAAAVAGAVYCPSFALPTGTYVETAFGRATALTAYNYNTARLDDVLNADERAFLQKAKAVLDANDLVLNEPYDGSVFAYANEDMRVYYRFLGSYGGGGEPQTSEVIRNHLCNVAGDSQVRDAVAATGARYLLVLDQGDQDTEDHRRYNIWYDSDQWVGIESVTDDTPGFEVVLSEGDMRLYRITALD